MSLSHGATARSFCLLFASHSNLNIIKGSMHLGWLAEMDTL